MVVTAALPGKHRSGPLSFKLLIWQDGYAVARAASERGADVVLISGPVEIECPEEFSLYALPLPMKCTRLFSAASKTVTYW